ncbi:MAG: adenosylcobinamide-phosphate synthase CbiB [Anaerovoracaceae bacterium]|jgi:adenosylcobinamide-phosphate synthase
MYLAIGFVLDMIIGDPHHLPHPVRAMGLLISGGEKAMRRIFPSTKNGERIGGAVLTILVMAVSFGVPFFLLLLLALWNPWFALGVHGIMCYQILAIKSLKKESMKVAHALKEDDVEKARAALSMIVGRDTRDLDREGITKAAVETVAENSADGAIAPMIYMAIGGAPLGFLYKSINTMDSMIGYKNDRYRYFGTFAAKLDDGVNFIPARISALLMILSAGILRLDMSAAAAIFKRDRFNHASPNSAQTEAVCAGALNVQLAGDAYYFGKLYEKKTIGDDIRPIVWQDIAKANDLHYAGAVLSFVLCMMMNLFLTISLGGGWWFL